jgi:DNA-binding NarL/FixJ family response regulator
MRITDWQFISLVGLALSALSTLISFALYIMLRRERRARRELSSIASEIEENLAALDRDVKSVSERLAEQERNALKNEWRAHDEESCDALSQAKPSLTERRYRVLKLARRGLDARAIASMLNVPHGEVELIIGLSRVA